MVKTAIHEDWFVFWVSFYIYFELIYIFVGLRGMLYNISLKFIHKVQIIIGWTPSKEIPFSILLFYYLILETCTYLILNSYCFVINMVDDNNKIQFTRGHITL